MTIPNSVTSIGGYAFRNCSDLTSVTIPNSVTSIGGYAFEDCSGLTSVTIPNSVTSIGESAFRGCAGLTSVTIPNSVTSIGNSAFSRCSGLTSITIPNSVTKIGSTAFYGCSGLTSVTIPNSVTGYLDAFRECSGLKEITIGRSVTNLPFFAFQGCKALESIKIRAKDNIDSDWNPPYQNYGCPFDNFDATIHVLKGYRNKFHNPWSRFKSIIDDLEPIYMEGLVIDVNNKHFEINESSLRANAIPTNDPDDNSVTWSTTTPDIMMVAPETGDFMGVRDGMGELVATANDGSGVIATAKVYFGNCYPQPDAIETVSSKNDIHTDETVYNLKGMRVDSHNLPAGIYIKNGKKVMVK